MAFDLASISPSWFDLSVAAEVLPQLIVASRVTILVSVASFILAIGLGLPLCLLRAQPLRALAVPVAVFVDFIRSTPVLLQVYFYYFGLPSVGIVMTPIVTGIAALGIYYGCYLAEVYRSGFESVPAGQWDAAKALNYTYVDTCRFIVLPQVLPQIIPAAGNYLIASIKDTPLLASIATAEVMFVAMGHGAEHFQYIEPITVSGLIYLVLSLAASMLTRTLERFVGRKWVTGRTVVG